MENYPGYKFVCSQPSQLAWLKEFYPSLFVELVEKAKNGQFVPIGGSWVEMVSFSSFSFYSLLIIKLKIIKIK